MDSLGSMATSGLTVTMTPAQLFVGAGLLGVVLLSNAKSLLFMWHVKQPGQLRRVIYANFPFRDDSSHNLHGISFYEGLPTQ